MERIYVASTGMKRVNPITYLVLVLERDETPGAVAVMSVEVWNPYRDRTVWVDVYANPPQMDEDSGHLKGLMAYPREPDKGDVQAWTRVLAGVLLETPDGEPMYSVPVKPRGYSTLGGEAVRAGERLVYVARVETPGGGAALGLPAGFMVMTEEAARSHQRMQAAAMAISKPPLPGADASERETPAWMGTPPPGATAAPVKAAIADEEAGLAFRVGSVEQIMTVRWRENFEGGNDGGSA